MEGVATDPVDLDDGLESVVQRVRKEIRAAGEHKAPRIGEYVSPLTREERDAIMALVRDGTYHRAAGRVGAEDPDLADQ